MAINGANVRSVSPYSGGTGVTVGDDGVVAIGQSVGASDGDIWWINSQWKQ